MSLRVEEVLTVKQIRLFHQFTRDLHKENDAFISHIDQDVDGIFNPNKNSEFSSGEAKRWLLYSNNTICGKVAAFYNRKTGFAGIGFFDSLNDQAIANKLFDTAIDWLKENGYNRVEAPVNFGERDKYWGLLVEGFNCPAYQENYNFPYYKELFETYGFTKSIVQTTSEARPDDIDYNKYKRFTDRLEERGGFKAKHFKISEMDNFVKDFTLIYNQAWEQHEHFVPFTEERVKALFTEMKPIIREDILWFLYEGNKPIAFYLSIIDLNQIFRHVNGNMNLWGKLKFLWFKNTVKINKIRGIIFGVVPEYQSKGVYSILIIKMFEVMKKDPNLVSTELAWIGDFNPKMHALFKSLNAKKVKVHFTYEKLF